MAGIDELDRQHTLSSAVARFEDLRTRDSLGETPLRGPGTASLRVGDRIWFRHAKAGEICEHVNELHTLDGDRLTGAWPTYRGEGKAFG